MKWKYGCSLDCCFCRPGTRLGRFTWLEVGPLSLMSNIIDDMPVIVDFNRDMSNSQPSFKVFENRYSQFHYCILIF